MMSARGLISCNCRVDGFLLKAVQEVVPRVQQAAGADFDSRISLKWENLR